MSFSSYDPGGRYRRRGQNRRNKFLKGMFFLMIICGACYWLGGEMVKASEHAFKQQAFTLKSERENLEKVLTELRAKVQTSSVRFNQLKEKYDNEVPKGDLKLVTDLAKKQLDDGIDSKRLLLAVRTARPPRNCSDPISKRFIVKTKAYRGPVSYVAFARGAVTITGAGNAAVNSSGKLESWFDPGKEVAIKFTSLGGKDVIKKSLLPIHHSMIIGKKEHRFTLAKGNRSFISVTSDSCDYP